MRRIIFLMGILLIHIGLFAQSKKEQAVITSVNTLHKAMLDADSAVLVRLAHPALSYGHSSGKVEDKAAFVSALASGRSDFVSIDVADQKITTGDKSATVRHTLSAQIVDGGKPATVKLFVLLVWVKESGRWQLLARQAVRGQ